MKAVVMAGGEGSRLRPLTIGRPKPMVPIVNVPVMEHILGLLRRHGIEEVVVTLQYLANVIQEYFGDGSDFGMKIHYAVEESPLGTAGSVKNAEELLDEPFLVISGDALTDFDLVQVVNYHWQKGSMATLVLYRVPNPLEYGVVIVDREGKVLRFLEKPSWGEVFSDTVNTGIYVLDGPILLGKGVEIRPNAVVHGPAVIGDYTIVEDRATIDRSVLWPNSYIGENADLHGALIGRQCSLKTGTVVFEGAVIGDNCTI